MNATTSHEMPPTGWIPSLPAADGAAVVHLSLACADHPWRAAWWRWSARLAARVRGHRLQLRRAAHYVAHARAPESLQRQWQALFAIGTRRDGDAPCAWLCTQPAIWQVHARLLGDLGVDLRRVLHLRQQSWHPHGVAACHQAQDQRLDCRLARSVRLTAASALLVVKTGFTDGAGRLVALVEDSYVVGHLPVADAAQAGDDAVWRRAIVRLRHRPPSLAAGEPGSRSTRLLVEPAAARRFQQIAGALAGATAARPAAVQGVHLRSLVACELSRWGIAASRLSITFLARVGPGRELVLVQRDEKFELVDAKGRLVAFGRY